MKTGNICEETILQHQICHSKQIPRLDLQALRKLHKCPSCIYNIQEMIISLSLKVKTEQYQKETNIQVAKRQKKMLHTFEACPE